MYVEETYFQFFLTHSYKKPCSSLNCILSRKRVIGKCPVNRQFYQRLSNNFYYEFYYKSNDKQFRFGRKQQLESLINRVPCVPAWFTCPSTNVPKAYQFFNLACQRAKGVTIFQLSVPTYQKACQFLNFACQNLHQFFKYFSKTFFNF